ncbi:MAG: hypothetical protein EOO10_02060 [Chitinophagaceae bacterium]|nr:MAG: hypothetical protein EOO10_02060 [Chitinophagaceae bacterium]
MKTIALCLLVSAFLVSCQEEASVDSAKENIWKKRTTADTNIARADADNTTNAPIDGGLGILLVTGVAYGAKRIMGQRKQKSA